MAKINEAEISSIRLKEQSSTPDTPASGYSAVYVKDDGLYIVDDAGGVSGPLGAGGSSSDAMVKITSVMVGSGGASSIVLPATGSIPSDYTNLLAMITARSSRSVAAESLYIRFNGDSGTNYQFQRHQWSGSSQWNDASGGGTKMPVGDVPGASASSYLSNAAKIEILGYKNTNFYKSILGRGYQANNYTTGAANQDVTGTWHNTAAITSITLLLESGNFVEGSVATLYGMP